jgi:hypothetical protein
VHERGAQPKARAPDAFTVAPAVDRFEQRPHVVT